MLSVVLVQHHRLISLLDDQPRALFVADVEFLRGSGFGGLVIRRLDEPEKLEATQSSQRV